MESLQVRTGQISLRILDDNGDERGIFKFNPQDIESAKKVVTLQDELNEKARDFETRESLCETPEDKLNLLSETCAYFRDLVDQCFGAGSSQTVFGDNNSLSMFFDFFEGIMPYYEKASKERVSKYKKPGTK